jgi:hypothetical protein
MKRVLAILSILALAACAPTKSPVKDPLASKCYLIDSTKWIAREDHARVFGAVETGSSTDSAFRPCNDSAAAGASVRVRPKSSQVATLSSSHIALGVNAALWGTGLGLAIANEAPLWLLLPGLQFGPTSRIIYEAEYKDAKGKIKREPLQALGIYWFKDREESKALLMEQAPRDLSTALYGKKYPKKKLPELSGRLSIDIAPLLFVKTLDEFRIAPRYEYLFPGNFAFNLAPQAIFSGSGKPRGASLKGGPRHYFFDDHAHFFMGVEPYYERQIEDGYTYSRAAIPVVAGFVDPGKGFFTGFDIGYGPAWVLNGAYKRERDYLFAAFYLGWTY